ncbi:MAG: hypothetical protein L0229_26100 [Blastocatellia bacterium]|nr:hypothetical protein [Blastocatellia bacterium]
MALNSIRQRICRGLLPSTVGIAARKLYYHNWHPARGAGQPSAISHQPSAIIYQLSDEY